MVKKVSNATFDSSMADSTLFIITFTYNNSKQILRTNEYSKTPLDSNNLNGFTDYAVDANGNLISETFYKHHQGRNTMEGKREYEYDTKFNFLTNVNAKDAIYWIWGDIYKGEGWEWISKNNIIKSTLTNGSAIKITTYANIYDSNGYPIKVTDSDGRVTEYKYK